MHAFTPTTSYPPAPFTPAQSHITLLDDFFRIGDSLASSPSASQDFASIFTNDGVWKTPSAAFSGLEQLRTSGSDWAFLREIESMRHWVLRVYANDAEGKELMLHGRIEVCKGGEVMEVDFGARVEMGSEQDEHPAEPKLRFFQGWSSSV